MTEPTPLEIIYNKVEVPELLRKGLPYASKQTLELYTAFECHISCPFTFETKVKDPTKLLIFGKINKAKSYLQKYHILIADNEMLYPYYDDIINTFNSEEVYVDACKFRKLTNKNVKELKSLE